VSEFEAIVEQIRACTVCERSVPPLPHAARPVCVGSARSRIRIIGQAPGTRVHASGRPFTDPSGDRLRDWLGVDPATFYDPEIFAITPMGFCFPGLDTKGSDRPPRSECGALWQAQLSRVLPKVELTLLVGMYAQAHVLDAARERTLTATVENWRSYGPDILPLPHPSWRNNGWLKRHDWFAEVIEHLQERVAAIVQRSREK
jgi:uracil-DNA glycosylase